MLLALAGSSWRLGGRRPVVSAAPTVIGTAAAGKRLTGLSRHLGRLRARSPTASSGTGATPPAAACLSIHGATSPTFALGDRDVGKTLGLTVTATDSTGTASAYASLVGPIAPRRPLLESTAQPVVDRAARRGQDRRR